MDSIQPLPAHVRQGDVFDFDIYADPRVDDDVQGSTAAVLAQAPDVFYTPRNGGHWVVRRFDAIAAILQDYEHFSAREMHIPRIPDHPVFIPLSLDPPQSMPYRHAMMGTFSARGVRALEPRMRFWAQKIVDEVAAGAGCDFIHDVAGVFPVAIFMELVDLPLAQLHAFRKLAGAYFRAHEPAEIQRLTAIIHGIFIDLIAQRRAAAGVDLVSQFLAADIDGRPLCDDEILAMCFLLFLGGMDTVTNVAGFAFKALAAAPELQARLAADPAAIAAFVEESLRNYPVINPSRLVIRDCVVGGAQIRAGEMLICMASEAGRDPAANPDPARFDIDREKIAHLTFAAGPHLCIGHILARAELRILTEAWMRRIPRFEATPGERCRFRMGAVTALESLPLRWGG